MPNPLAHFEIHATDPEKLADFYRAVFDWKIEKWDSDALEYWVVYTNDEDKTKGINGGLVRRHGTAPAHGAPVSGYVSTMIVTNFDEIAKKILENGGVEALPKFALAGMAWQGYFLDPDGNIFGIHQPDTNAK